MLSCMGQRCSNVIPQMATRLMAATASSQSAVVHEEMVGDLVYKEVDYSGHAHSDSDVIVSAACNSKELLQHSQLNSLSEEDRLTDLVSSSQSVRGISYWSKEPAASTSLNAAATFVVNNCQAMPGINLSSCAPGNVPRPESTNLQNTNYSHLHFPGSSTPKNTKFLMSSVLQCHQSRNLHTRAGMQESSQELEDFPQGIQSDNQAKFTAWFESARAYRLGDVTEGHRRMDTGTSDVNTLLQEQQSLLEHIAVYIREQGIAQEMQNTAQRDRMLEELHKPCPQGMTGPDCVRYKMWLANCIRFGYGDSETQLSELKDGRRCFNDLLDEQNRRIREAVEIFRSQIKY